MFGQEEGFKYVDVGCDLMQGEGFTVLGTRDATGQAAFLFYFIFFQGFWTCFSEIITVLMPPTPTFSKNLQYKSRTGIAFGKRPCVDLRQVLAQRNCWHNLIPTLNVEEPVGYR